MEFLTKLVQGSCVLTVPEQNHPVTRMDSGFQTPLVTAVLVCLDVMKMKMQPDNFFLCGHLGNEKGVEGRHEPASSGMAKTRLNE